MQNIRTSELQDAKIIIIPCTHWDREWYLDFQSFRYQLVQLFDQLLEINEKQDYYFMFDGQTVVLEDYFEIKPQNKEKVLKLIRDGKIGVGPLYLLPDEWLVGEENLIRNLEMSYKLCKTFEIPMMKVMYLPDQFGHSPAIPQFIADITELDSVVLWRGVPQEVNTVPFNWKRHEKAKSQILGVYLPHGYGNAAHLNASSKQDLEDEITNCIADLVSYSPFPVYLLMNGTDHQQPSPGVQSLLTEIDLKADIKISSMEEFVYLLKTEIKAHMYEAPTYIGEFRSPARAPMLQDTYSARIWIKQWNQVCEDLLTNYAEPLSTHLYFHELMKYPEGFMDTAWRWLLKNAPHDSICGCSIDQTHEEMKTRFSWSESISRKVLEENMKLVRDTGEMQEEYQIYVFNHTNSNIPQMVHFKVPANIKLRGLRAPDGSEFAVELAKTTEEVMIDEIMNPFLLKQGLRLLMGRKFEDAFINKVQFLESADPNMLIIRLEMGDTAIGDLNVDDLKQQVRDYIDSKQYGKFHVLATKGAEQGYYTKVPLKPWTFSSFTLLEDISIKDHDLLITKNSVSNKYFELTFKKDGSFSMLDKTTNILYEKLHVLEDTGDRGDLYTFGKVLPTSYKTSKVKRKILTQGPVFNEIEQKLILNTFEKLGGNRDTRKGKAKIPIKTVFRFYHDLPRIDMETTLTNTAENHRLRLGFNLPYPCDKTITATHFGVVKRDAQPIREGEFMERPSGIQAQKRFVRVEGHNSALTLINHGLPELELDRDVLSLTLLRSVGHLSRMDFEERPMHAGPAVDTPGGQEMGKEFNYKYALLLHSSDEPIHFSADHSEVAFIQPTAVAKKTVSQQLLEEVFSLDNPSIRISSFRALDDAILVTMYNLEEEPVSATMEIHEKLKKAQSVLVGGIIKENLEVVDHQLSLKFEPFEIKMIQLSQ
ncbi:MAG: hypothetical protein INQ03_24930 [Candidatus Heimdallarchaeota archaeon]|nr:hypothetical protein [Candidatus Heimdallarchaeota archaeon]